MTDAHPAPDAVGVLFDPEPATWGVRGDPYLWRSLDTWRDTLFPLLAERWGQ